MFTSIPYDKGWTVTVDGKPAETRKVFDAFLALELEPGEHEIGFSYWPPGLNYGLILTAASAGILVILFAVRQLMETDVDAMLALCSGNPQFYRYHPPMATKASILDDLQAVPPGKTLSDKYFIGFYDGETLAAMMDLITGYPNPATAYIGLFMVDAAQQGRGTGSALIADCKQALRAEQFKTLRLAIDEGNPQSKAFWQKNGFALTGQRTPNENGAYLPMECEL